MVRIQMADGYDAGAAGPRSHGRTSAAERRPVARGFSLVEVLIVASVMAVALLGAATLFPVSQSQIYGAASRAQATTIARGRLELIKNKGAGVFTAGFTTSDCPTSTTANLPAGLSLSCTAINASPQIPVDTARIVTLTVSWGGPQQGSVTMSAPVMRPD